MTNIRELLKTHIAEHNLTGLCNSSALRNTIEAAVFDGDLKPTEAEDYARVFGWRPYAGWADPAPFDPTSEATWTLPMVAAWIDVHERAFHDVEDQITLESIRADDFRSEGREAEYVALPEAHIRRAVSERNAELRADAVRRVMPAYVAASKRWARVYSDGTDEELGFELAPRIYRGWMAPPNSIARARLIAALAEGRIVGERLIDGAWTAIQSGDWHFLNVMAHDGDDDGVCFVLDADGRNIGDVRMSREAAMRVWPAPCS